MLPWDGGGEPKFSWLSEWERLFYFSSTFRQTYISTFLAKAFLSFQFLIEYKYCSDAFD